MQEFGGVSSIVLAFVAVLWVGLLVPAWVRDHNERQAQRNAIRLQQTVRALAATAERPEVVELEATARTVRAQRRELRRAERAAVLAERERARLAAEAAERELEEERLRAETWRVAAELRSARLAAELEKAEAEMVDAEARRAAAARAREAARLAAEREALAAGTADSAQERWANGASGAERAVHRRLTAETPRLDRARMAEAAARRRRGRLASTGVGFAGLIALVVGMVLLGTGVAAVGGTVAIVAGGVCVGGAVWMLQRIHLVAAAAMRAPATEAPVETAPAAAERVAAETAPFVVHDIEPTVAPAPASEKTWTPVPLPKPLYLEKATAGELPPTDPSDPTDPDRPSRHEDQVDRDLAALLREESAKATEALRAAHRAAEGGDFGRGEVSRAERIAPITVGTNDWRRMGDVDALADEYGAGDCADLDAVLRRRRAG